MTACDFEPDLGIVLTASLDHSIKVEYYFRFLNSKLNVPHFLGLGFEVEPLAGVDTDSTNTGTVCLTWRGYCVR